MRDITRKHGTLLDDLPKLGPAITRSVPEQVHGPPLELDVEDDQNLNSKYVLSGAQRRIIKTQKINKRSDQNDNILQKRDELPDRVQHLIDDVALLCDSPYVSTERWEEGIVNRKKERSRYANLSTALEKADRDGKNLDRYMSDNPEEREIDYYETPFDSPADFWDELIDVDQRSQQIRNDVFFAGKSIVSKETQFGYELGNLIQMLRPADTNDTVGIDLIWGFILAFIGQSKSDMKKERELLNEVVAEINDRHDTRMEDANLIPDLEEIIEQRSRGYRLTAEAIEEEGIEPHPIVVEEVLYHQTEFEENEKIHKGNARKILAEIEDIVPLRVVDDLYTRLAADITTVEKETTQEIDSVKHVIEAFQAIPADEDSSIEDTFIVGSKRTADISGSVGVRKHAITPVLNRLSGDKETKRWTTTPIVVNKNNGMEWRLTAYGKLLLYVFQNHQGDPSTVYRFAIGPEEISLQYRKLILEVLDEQGDVTEATS